MLFAVHCLDRPDSAADRKTHFDAHMAHLKSAAAARIVLSGPLLADDEQTTVGSFFILEAPSKADATAFNQTDPFSKAGIWKDVSIHPFLKRIDNRT